jgi:hypothetical protein
MHVIINSIVYAGHGATVKLITQMENILNER